MIVNRLVLVIKTVFIVTVVSGGGGKDLWWR